MSKRKRARSWKKLMRQREQERNRFGSVRQHLIGFPDIDSEDDEMDFDEDENSEEYEYLWAEGIRDFGVR